MHLADPKLQRLEQRPMLSLVRKANPAGGLQTGEMLLRDPDRPETSQGELPHPKKTSREVLSPKDPQILRDPMGGCPDVSGGLLTMRTH